MAATYLSWPMQIGSDGRFRTTSNSPEVWSNRLAQLVCARMGERVMRPDYGTEFTNDLFQNALGDPNTSIRRAVTKWLPHLTIDNVKVTSVGATHEVVITYTTPNRQMLTTSVSVGTEGVS